MTVRLATGEVIAERFTLIRRIAGELPGELWHAEDTALREPAIVRLLQPATVPSRQLLEAASEDVDAVVHPALLRTYYHEVVGEELVVIASEGRDGLAPLNWNPAHSRDQLRSLLPILDALEFAHHLGRAHGHLNRWTILCDPSGHAYLSEFGAGSLLSLLGARGTSGTVRQGGHGPSAPDDIRGLGALLFEAVTGASLAEDASPPEVRQRLEERALPGSLTPLIARMLDPAPYERPSSVGEVAAILRDQIDAEAGRFGAVPPFVRATDEARDIPTAARPVRRMDAPISRREIQVMSLTSASALLLVLIVLLGGVLLLPSALREERSQEVRYAAPAVESAQERSRGPEEQVEAGPAPFELAMSEHMRDEADQLATQLLRQQVYLEDTGVMLWARDEFQAAQRKGEAGDTYFREQEYEAALDQFQQGTQMLQQLEESIPEVLDRALRDGREALAAGDEAAAVDAYLIVQAIEPEHPEAARGLKRSETLARVFAMNAEASEHESAGEFEQALELLNEITAIDPAMSLAREGIGRVERKIRERDFQRAMTSGLNALADGEFEQARSAFTSAGRLMPDAVGPKDGLEQVELALRLRQIEAHRTRAEAFEQREDWHGAAAEYGAALELDGALVFAARGKVRAEERAEIHDRLTRYLENPRLLTNSANYDLATALHARASALDARGPLLQQRLDGLAELIRLTRIPVQVEIHSDNVTDVTVYRVGRLGRLKSTTVTLYPGTYRVQGTRRGYRDQQLDIEVVPGQTPPVTFVSCTEKI